MTGQTDAREVYVGLTRHRADALVVAEKERLAASATRSDALVPGEAEILNALATEADVMREKANVVDYVENAAAFIATDEVVVRPIVRPHPIIELARRATRGGLALAQSDGPVRQSWVMRNRERPLGRQARRLVDAVRDRLVGAAREPDRSFAPDIG